MSFLLIESTHLLTISGSSRREDQLAHRTLPSSFHLWMGLFGDWGQCVKLVSVINMMKRVWKDAPITF